MLGTKSWPPGGLSAGPWPWECGHTEPGEREFSWEGKSRNTKATGAALCAGLLSPHSSQVLLWHEPKPSSAARTCLLCESLLDESPCCREVIWDRLPSSSWPCNLSLSSTQLSLQGSRSKQTQLKISDIFPVTEAPPASSWNGFAVKRGKKNSKKTLKKSEYAASLKSESYQYTPEVLTSLLQLPLRKNWR